MSVFARDISFQASMHDTDTLNNREDEEHMCVTFSERY